MGAREVQQNLSRLSSNLRRIGTIADAPTVWQRLTPNKQAQRMNEFRELLSLKRLDGWPDIERPEIYNKLLRDHTRSEIYTLSHEDATPPDDLHHWHQQVSAVVDADTPLSRGQLLTWDLEDPTDLDTRSPRAVPATVANTLLKRNYDLLIVLNNTGDEVPDYDHYAITSRDGLFARMVLPQDVEVGDLVCFTVGDGGVIQLVPSSVHQWPDCHMEVMSKEEDGTYTFAWHTLDVSLQLRRLSSPEHVCKLPDSVGPRVGCMTLLTGDTTEYRLPTDNQSPFWLRARTNADVNIRLARDASSTIEGDSVLPVDHTMLVTYSAGEDAYHARVVGDASDVEEFELIHSSARNGNYTLPTSNNFFIVGWMADWLGGKTIRFKFNNVEIATLVGVYSGPGFRSIDISAQTWSEVGETLESGVGPVIMEVSIDDKVQIMERFDVGYGA